MNQIMWSGKYLKGEAMYLTEEQMFYIIIVK